MTLRADDGTLLEVKEPVVLGPETQSSSKIETEREIGAGRKNDSFRKTGRSRLNPQPPLQKIKVFDFSKWGFWLAPLAILAVIAFLFFGTLFFAVFVGIAILVSILKRLVNVFRL